MIFVICGAKNGYYESIEDARKDMDFFVIEYRERQWNGEVYGGCGKYKDRYGLNVVENETYEITPVYMGEGEPDEDGDYDSYDVIGYVVKRE